MKTVISTPKAPAAIGPYSQAIRKGDTLYLSGQIGMVPATGAEKQDVFTSSHRFSSPLN